MNPRVNLHMKVMLMRRMQVLSCEETMCNLAKIGKKLPEAGLSGSCQTGISGLEAWPHVKTAKDSRREPLDSAEKFKPDIWSGAGISGLDLRVTAEISWANAKTRTRAKRERERGQQGYSAHHELMGVLS